MAKTPYLSAPQKTEGMPPAIAYIVGNEAAERFSFYGMRAILVVYMTQYLRGPGGALAVMNENSAAEWYHWFVASNYFFPIFGAILADAFWGKYRTIISLSLVYCLGHAALSADGTRLGLVAGLGLIAIGAGGIKPCVSANVGDQFGKSNKHLVSKAFGWFYFSVNAGSTVSIWLIPLLLQHFGPRVAFAVPGILMVVATVVFWAGRYKFVHIPPKGREFLSQTFSSEGLGALGKLAIIFAFVAVFWSLWDQCGGEWVLQANKMDLHFLGVTWLASQVQLVNAIMILIFIPLFQYVIYPAIDKVFPLTPLRKIGLGLLVTSTSFLVSAFIESQLAAGLKPNIAWQFPGFAILSVGEVMVSITALEFAYTQSPVKMKSVVMSLYLLSISAGDAFTALVHQVIANPDGTTKLSGVGYYLFFAGLCAVSGIVFALVATQYKEKTYLQEQAA